MVVCKLCHKNFRNWTALVNHKWHAHRRTMLKGARKGLAKARKVRKARRGNPNPNAEKIKQLQAQRWELSKEMMQIADEDSPEYQELVHEHGLLGGEIMRLGGNLAERPNGKRKNPCGKKARRQNRQIVAKYPGMCRRCGGEIMVGSTIEWEPGQGARHVGCQPSEAAVPRSERCANCGGPGGKHLRYDMSGIGGYVCNRCSRYSREEFSFA